MLPEWTTVDSPGAPSRKLANAPRLEMSHGKRRAQRLEGAGAIACEQAFPCYFFPQTESLFTGYGSYGARVCHRCGEVGGATN